ncbi:MAG: cytochrome c [Anaerolineales bacterium]|nr:cytochrome c [Anaerolineales bacterium]
MLGNILGLILIALVAVLFVWLAVRAWRSRRRAARWAGAALAGLLALALALLAGVTARGLAVLYLPRRFPVPAVQAPSTAAALARGEHLALVACAPCHSPNGALPLAGGSFSLGDEIGLPLGTLVPPNLTPGGELSDWSDGEVVRAIRQGTHRSGRVLVMPAHRLQHMSDEDVLAVVAYLRSQALVAHSTPAARPSLLLAFFLGAGLLNLDVEPITAPVAAPARAATTDYGAYIVSFLNCRDCHGENLDGRPSGPLPPGPDLRVVQGWTQEDFIATLRLGVDPSGHELQPPMRWKQYGQLDDLELAAVYASLRTLPPSPER